MDGGKGFANAQPTIWGVRSTRESRSHLLTLDTQDSDGHSKGC